MLSARMALARSLRDGIDNSPVFFRKRLQAAKTAQKEGEYFRRLLCAGANPYVVVFRWRRYKITKRSEEHTSELQSRPHLVCRLLLEKKKKSEKRNMVAADYTV